MSKEVVTIQKKIKISKISIVLATLFLSVFGAIWYGILFADVQVQSHRFTSQDYENNSPLWNLGGLIISFFIACGLSLIIRLQGKKGVKAGIVGALQGVLGFGIPLVSYPYVFSPLHDFALYMVGLWQIVIAWTIAGAIIGAMMKVKE